MSAYLSGAVDIQDLKAAFGYVSKLERAPLRNLNVFHPSLHLRHGTHNICGMVRRCDQNHGDLTLFHNRLQLPYQPGLDIGRNVMKIVNNEGRSRL